MVIDFRVRPPYKSFLQLGIFPRWANPVTDPLKMSPFGMGRDPVPSCEQGSMELFLKEMDEAGVNKCVVMGRRTRNSSTGAGNVEAEELRELALAYPDRFLPFAGIDPTDDDAPAQVEQAGNMGFKGISMDPGWCVPALYADDNRVLRVCEACERLGLIAVITHSAVVGPDLGYCDPCAIQHVAQAFPHLNIVVAHASWPNIEKALGMAMLCPNVYLCPDVYFYTDNMPMSEHLVTAANGYLKYRMLFASTYPVGGLKQSVEKGSRKGLTQEALRLTLHDNAARLLQLAD